ncbi:MAG: erythromycin esterase family protein [Candidatus Hydrogenedentes bacterium]|nr:erythromycin esterase family protein [Candidatus Hydrogenedentota bacterium]
MPKPARYFETDINSKGVLTEWVREISLPLNSEADLDPLFEQIGDARFVLLGEASHGTAEFYAWRAAISRRLIAEKGFSFIAVEGDWPDCYRVNRYVAGHDEYGETAREVLETFQRWPTWMWANHEVAAMAEWMRQHNRGVPEDRKAGFYGLDVYSLWESLHSILGYLERVDGSLRDAAWRAFRCFEPYSEDVHEYARATRFVPESCEDEVIELLKTLRSDSLSYLAEGRDTYFAAQQNAVVLKNAEAYYRAMVRGGPGSWNIRNRHMMETLDRLITHHGMASKAIVWAHNTHIGDARFTDMLEGGEVNIGQLVRERRADDGVVLVGFASHRGAVIAGPKWEAPMERMQVPPGRSGSWEHVLHEAGAENKLVVFGKNYPPAEALVARGHRAIGVVYNPEFEWLGNYVPSILPRRYDALLYFDMTEALHPLHEVQWRAERHVAETYPLASK